MKDTAAYVKFLTEQERELARLEHEYHEAHRTEPDYWVRKAENAIRWRQPEKVPGYLALARFYRDAETS
jgi:hypothetical protein